MIAALILAGGRGSRLGYADKALLPIGAGTALDILLDRLRPQAGPIALSANGDPGRFARFNLPILPDAEPDQGPLQGLLAGLDWAASLGAAALLTVPCDTPFIPGNLVENLGAPPACAASAGRTHHLTALWPTTASHALRAYLKSNTRVSAFAALLDMRAVTWPIENTIDPFFNINTSEDLENLLSRA